MLIQPQDLSYLLVIKGTDSYGSQTKGSSLQMYVLPGMSYFHMHIPFPPTTVSPQRSLIFGTNDYIQRGSVDKLLVQCRSGQL